MDPVTMSLLGGAGAGALSSMFNRQKNPARAGRPYMDKIPGIGEQYYSPYVNRGEQANQQAGDIYSQLSADPQAFLQQIMQGYKPTEGYKYQSKMAQDAAHNAAAAGGYVGGEFDQRNRADLANTFASQDMQQYINNILQMQGTGLAGLQNQGQMGFQASGGLADYLGNAYGNRAQFETGGKQFQQQGRNNLASGLLGAAGTMGGAYLGGPMGAQMGGQLGSRLGGSQGQYGMGGQQFSDFARNQNWGRQGWR